MLQVSPGSLKSSVVPTVFPQTAAGISRRTRSAGLLVVCLVTALCCVVPGGPEAAPPPATEADADDAPSVRNLLAQLSRLFLGRGVAQEAAAPNFWACQVLQEIWFSQGRVDFDVKMKAIVSRAVRRCLVQRHDVRKRHLPEIVESNQGLPQYVGEVKNLLT